MERHRRNLLKGGLESLSQNDLSNNRPGRLLNKLHVPFQHSLARSVATQSSLTFLFFPSWQAEHCVCSSAPGEAPGSYGVLAEGQRQEDIFSAEQD